MHAMYVCIYGLACQDQEEKEAELAGCWLCWRSVVWSGAAGLLWPGLLEEL